MKEVSQIKSKDRVANHGEVFTNSKEVNAMLDLVKDETERINSRFLEPACGEGNFLIEILRRKLSIVNQRYKMDSEWKLNSAIAFSSVYGVELLYDNTISCRNRLFEMFYNEFYHPRFKEKDDVLYLNVIKFFLKTNIICGDALKLVDEKGYPLIFAEWGWINNKIQRRDFSFSGLLTESREAYKDFSKDNALVEGQLSLFDDEIYGDEIDENFENAGLIKENKYSVINYMELGGMFNEGI